MAQLFGALNRIVEAVTKPPPPPVDRTLPEQPITMDNLDENIKAAKQFYDMNKRTDMHVAVLGAKGVGKSSLINALCSRANDAAGAAPVGRSNSTPVQYRIPTLDAVVLWDMPGAGVGHPSLSYFADKQLCAFDLLMLVSDRFHRADFDVARCAIRLGRRVIFVRTKADIAVQQILEREKTPKIEHIDEAFKILREEVTASFREGLRISGLGDKRSSLTLFIVSAKRFVELQNVYSAATLGEEEEEEDDERTHPILDEDNLYLYLSNLIRRSAVRRTRTMRRAGGAR